MEVVEVVIAEQAKGSALGGLLKEEEAEEPPVPVRTMVAVVEVPKGLVPTVEEAAVPKGWEQMVAEEEAPI